MTLVGPGVLFVVHLDPGVLFRKPMVPERLQPPVTGIKLFFGNRAVI